MQINTSSHCEINEDGNSFRIFAKRYANRYIDSFLMLFRLSVWLCSYRPHSIMFSS